MTVSIFLSACTVNSANSVRMTNSPGRRSGSIGTLAGKLCRSRRAPHGRGRVAHEPPPTGGPSAGGGRGGELAVKWRRVLRGGGYGSVVA